MDDEDVKCEREESTVPTAADNAVSKRGVATMTFGRDRTLCDSIAGLWKSRTYADVRVECGEGGGAVDCHRLILSALSSMVAEALETQEDTETAVIIAPDVDSASLESFLSKVYGGGPDEADIPEELAHMGFSLSLTVRASRIKRSSVPFSYKVKSEPLDSDAMVSEELGYDLLDMAGNDYGSYRPSERSFCSKRSKGARRKLMGNNQSPWDKKNEGEVNSSAVAEQVGVDIKLEDDDVDFNFDKVSNEDSGGERDDHDSDPDYLKSATAVKRDFTLRGGRKRTSPVWEFFTTVEKEMNKCNICGALVRSVKQNTTNMMKHLMTNHPGESASLATAMDKKVKTEVKHEEGGDRNAARRAYSPRKRKSMVWRYFSRVDNESTKCELCSRVMVTRTGSTTSMTKHLKGNHRAEYKALFSEMGMEPPKEEAAGKGKTFGPLKKRGPKAQYDDDPKHRTCPDCKKEYSCRQAMLYHVKVVHSGIRPFCCQECGMTFARADSFRGHSHSLERTFLCSVCGKTFARRNIRDVHERAHYNDRRYPCSFCEKKFMTNQQKRRVPFLALPIWEMLIRASVFLSSPQEP